MTRSLCMPSLLLVCALLGCTEERKPRMPPVAEVSATFDMADIGPFLARLSEVTLRSFDRRRADLLTKWIGEQAIGSEASYIYAVVVDGRKADMRIVVRIEEQGAVDLHFSTDPELARRIDLLMDEFFE